MTKVLQSQTVLSCWENEGLRAGKPYRINLVCYLVGKWKNGTIHKDLKMESTSEH